MSRELSKMASVFVVTIGLMLLQAIFYYVTFSAMLSDHPDVYRLMVFIARWLMILGGLEYFFSKWKTAKHEYEMS